MFDLGRFVYAGHYALLHHVLTRYQPSGVALEFGVGAGESTRLIAQHMPVIGFDSFDGLPQDWREGFPAGMFAQDEIPDVDARLVVGLFEDTLPSFDFAALDVGLVHFDADLYSSTAAALKYCAPALKAGTILVFDEFHGYPGCESHEQKAWGEFSTGLEWDVLGHSQEQWSIRLA